MCNFCYYLEAGLYFHVKEKTRPETFFPHTFLRLKHTFIYFGLSSTINHQHTHTCVQGAAGACNTSMFISYKSFSLGRGH